MRCWSAVIARQAELVARWLLVGFIHGVMNTDNTSISGETIDYGPCAFMDHYDPAHGVQLDRRDGPLCLRQPAADRAVEPDAARRMPVAADFRRSGKGHRGGAGGARRLRREVRHAPIRRACAASSACSPRATTTRRWRRTCWTRWPKNQADFTLTFRRLSDAALDPADDARGPAVVRRPRRL